MKYFYAIISGNMNCELGKIHLEGIKDTVEKFRNEAINKHNSIGAESTQKKLDYIFKRIKDLPIDAEEGLQYWHMHFGICMRIL